MLTSLNDVGDETTNAMRLPSRVSEKDPAMRPSGAVTREIPLDFGST